MRSFRSSREPSIITQYNAQILHLLPPLYNRNFTPANFPSSALLSPPLSSSTVSTITSFHSTFRKQCYCMQHTVLLHATYSATACNIQCYCMQHTVLLHATYSATACNIQCYCMQHTVLLHATYSATACNIQCYCMQHTVVHTFSFMIHAIQATCNRGIL